MTAFEIVVAAYLAFIPPVLGALFVRRFDRVERRLDRMEDRFDEISGAIALCATREEMGELRRETAALRSDLTQVALAVGARPRASEG